MRANRWLSPGAPGVHHEERLSVGVVLLRERLEARIGGTLALARQCNDAKRGTVERISNFPLSTPAFADGPVVDFDYPPQLAINLETIKNVRYRSPRSASGSRWPMVWV